MTETNMRPTATMKAIVRDNYGAAEVLHHRDIARPTPAHDEVLIRVGAASVGAWDWHDMTGEPLAMRLSTGFRQPKTAVLGRDVAGQVEAVGPGVTAYSPGDMVYGECPATFAEYTIATEDQIAPAPARLSVVEAAAVPIAGVTALLGLRDEAKVKPGDSVLIVGAAGGVGTFAVQIAKAMGAEVTAVCSPESAEIVRSLGAEYVIDYTAEDFTNQSTRYDVLFQIAGSASVLDCRRALKRTGRLVLCSGEGGERVFGPMARLGSALVLGPFLSQKVKVYVAKAGTENLEALTELINRGEVTPVIDKVYPLAEASAALQRFGHGHGPGKIVLTT